MKFREFGLIVALGGCVGATASAQVPQGLLDCGDVREGRIRDEGEVHQWRLAAFAGDLLNIAVGSEQTAFFPTWKLIGPDGAVIGSGESVDDLRRITVSGSYTLEVKDGRGGDGGTYSVQAVWLNPESACAAPLSCGTFRERIDEAIDHDTYLISGWKGDVLNIAVAPDRDSELRPVWTLFGPDGSAVDGVRQTDQIRVLPVDGDYVLLIEDGNLRRVGGYALSMQGISEQANCDVALSCDDTYVGLIDSLGQHDAYSLSLERGEVVRIGVERVDPESRFNPDWTLASPQGRPIARTANEPGVLTAEQPGLYTLVVADHKNTGGGKYHVSVRSLVGGRSCATELIPGEWESVQLTYPGQGHSFAFELDRRDWQLEFDREGDFGWDLYAADGEAVEMDRRGQRFRFEQPKPGRYTLLLRGNDPDVVVGDLAVRLIAFGDSKEGRDEDAP